MLFSMHDPCADDGTYAGLVCRGVEESGGYVIGKPGFGPHLISLFAAGPNPHAPACTLSEHVTWVNDPLHSYVADGTGCLCVWAHPAETQAQEILSLSGLTGIKVNHAGKCLLRDELWDTVLRGCIAQDRRFLWGFAADDTHSLERIDLSWYAARLDKVDEFALKRALRTGAFYISSGPVIEDIQVHNRRITLRLERPAQVLWLRAGQFLSAEPTPQIAVTSDVGANHSLQWDIDTAKSTFDLDTADVPIDQFHFVRAIVRSDPSTIAHTQPWRIATDGSIDNPYPADGTWVRGQTHNHTDTWADRPSRLNEFRRAYQAQGQLASFSTDYNYWETPYQFSADDNTPQIISVTPDRLPAGQTGKILIAGANLLSGSTLQLSHIDVPVTKLTKRHLQATVPATLESGIYDVVVTTRDGFRGTLPAAFFIHSLDADNTPWQSYDRQCGLLDYPCTDIICTHDRVWVASVAGLSCFHQNAWSVEKEAIKGQAAYAVGIGPAERLWVSGNAGLSVCPGDGMWQQTAVGHPNKRYATKRWGGLAFTPAGDLWVTNRWGGGMAYCANDIWT